MGQMVPVRRKTGPNAGSCNIKMYTTLERNKTQTAKPWLVFYIQIARRNFPRSGAERCSRQRRRGRNAPWAV